MIKAYKLSETLGSMWIPLVCGYPGLGSGSLMAWDVQGGSKAVLGHLPHAA
jgi:hypothetical protein